MQAIDNLASNSVQGSNNFLSFGDLFNGLAYGQKCPIGSYVQQLLLDLILYRLKRPNYLVSHSAASSQSCNSRFNLSRSVSLYTTVDNCGLKLARKISHKPGTRQSKRTLQIVLIKSLTTYIVVGDRVCGRRQRGPTSDFP